MQKDNMQNEVNLTNCDKEPIHLSGHIQPFGFLIVLNESLQIEQVSSNIKAYLNGLPGPFVGTPLSSLLSADEFLVFRHWIREKKRINPQVLSFRGKQFFCFVHASGQKLVLECETYRSISEKEKLENGIYFSQLQVKLNNLTGIEYVLAEVATFMQAFLDYDRVLVFQFDEDWHSKVVAEANKPGIHSFKEYHFPATDIPAPARVLLKKKLTRHIPDVSAQAIPIEPYLNPSTNTPTDLLLSELRYSSRTHLEYLQNMKVEASLSFSVMVKGRLWGIISCGNEKPQYVDYWKRQLGEQVTHLLSAAIYASQEERDNRQYQHYKEQEKLLITQAVNSPNLVNGLLQQELNLLAITKSTGAAIFLNNELHTIGECPGVGEIERLLAWLRQHTSEPLFYTRELSSFIENAKEYQDKASGLLALEISRYNNEYILFFKPEEKELRVWAGQPDKAPAKKNKEISPRKSFEKWEEEISGKSKPWSLNEREIAQVFIKDVIALRLKNQAETLGALNKDLQLTAANLNQKNNQLEDFARIVTHNLRSPLTNIKGLLSLYQDEKLEEERSAMLGKIKMANENMLETIDDLYLVLKARHGQEFYQPRINIRQIIEKEKQQLEALIRKTGAVIQSSLLVEEFVMPKVYLESIIHNLLSNALKYRSPERKLIVHIKSWHEKRKAYLSVSDNGLGIDLDKFGSRIFGLYETYHTHKESRGLGLYLVRDQVESLGGEIFVESRPNVGTTFTVRLDYNEPK